MIGSAPTFSVSDFVAIFNQSISLTYPEVTIVGELANFRISKNTWVYFDLKDETASVKFFGSVRQLPGPLEDGMLLEVAGRPYLHPQFGFSIQFQAVGVAGKGSINKAQALLAKKLEKEGLFDPARKRPLPYASSKIAIVSSKESAGYEDFIKVTKKRWPMLKTKLFDVKVQGINAPKEIVSAIARANQGDFEVLVIIRGGGSRDDLSAFDHEQVVRAVASSRIPTLVAIGHERDVVLAELTADVRASTPSNAGEILVPDIDEERATIFYVTKQLDQFLQSFAEGISEEIKFATNQMDFYLQNKFNEATRYYEQTSALLLAYDPKTPLKKGYAIARGSSGLIKSSAEAKNTGRFNLEFYDGEVAVNTKG